ncbi:hypothetical protein CHGG_07011 [Chaetomium globosum CBS 148.51]|uniref:ubiquitinyl hydrolase 1 n=1 Tax=Chaetomium globosum (strain ATCC 6205 / CBS 148.51 / DSM 1962 / NBRC 6347 / NRRL 1970) TaxID=306901 RepID=Q2GYE3_CHAGB|nr:uncharacterized protein CHGG_07011 [Chaetomium globosum CBS 148.51]EAQ85758.1 hypothetical protein CHGG_07011 [Chaetomium globosum CBS 148.51]
MNNRGHLPAGQQVQGGTEMGPAPAGGPPPRRGGRSQHYLPVHAYHHGQHAHHGHHQQHAGQPMYPQNYMANPYAGGHYYPPPHYQNGAMSGPPGYMFTNNGYGRSPPVMQHFVPLQQPYGRQSQHSPIVSSPYHPPPPVAASINPSIPHTPSSTHSHAPLAPMTPPAVQQLYESAQLPLPNTVQLLPQPTQTEPQLGSRPVPQQVAHVPRQMPDPVTKVSPTPSSPPRQPFRPPRLSKLRMRKKLLGADAERVELPEQHAPGTEPVAQDEPQDEAQNSAEASQRIAGAPTKAETSATSTDVSVTDGQLPETAALSAATSSPVQPVKTSPAAPPTPTAVKPAVPAVPVVPAVPTLPKASPKETRATASVEKSAETTPAVTKPDEQQTKPVNPSAENVDGAAPAIQPAPAWTKPKLWAGLFKGNGAVASTSSATTDTQGETNGNTAEGPSAVSGAGSFAKANASSLAQALQAYRPSTPDRLAFLEPRGLVNTGNMCYMNSVLQVLIFCVPFFDFLDQVSKKATHSFKSDTPLVDAMVMFMREFKSIDSAASADQLKKRLKSEEYEKYGEPFTPAFVYEAIRNLPRFASMRRGHQEDAQEFLGFLLEGLHDECAQVMRAAPNSTASTAPPSPTSSRANESVEGTDDWLEVGPRQRSAVTRSSGHSHTLSPINKIFGGHLRSEFRVPGKKNSVTLEPYQPLQLDIGSPEVRNIIDALKGLTRSEVLHGDFNSPHGKDVRATKQVFIESVPPVLVLHLKRFQFDAEGYGGTVKIWKKIGYPLEFEFPREVLSRQTRNNILAGNSGAPRYRLISVIYHHGKNASGRVRNEDVAEGGAEEDASKAEGRRDAGNLASGNRFVGINDEDTGDEEGWKQAAGGKKWSSVVNNAAPATTNGQKAKQQHKESMKENKVAYLLFYQRI